MSEDTHWNPYNMIYGDDGNIPSIAAILQSGSLYVYCVNNPVNLLDYWGNAYIALRAMVDSFGGSITWNTKTAAATVTIGNKTGVFIENPYAFSEGAVDPFILGETMYVDGMDFYKQMGIISYGYEADGTSGKVIIKSDNNANISTGNNDFIVLDNRREPNPSVKIMNSYRANSTNQRLEILKILVNLQQNDPTQWRRDIDSMENEWYWHNVSYFVGYERQRTADVDLDNYDAINYPRNVPWGLK